MSKWLSLAVLVPLLGCGGDVPSFPKVRRDSGVECTSPSAGGTGGTDGGMDAGSVEEVPCPAGEVCLQGRCYPRCGSDLDCAQTEQCDDGVCVARTRERPDAGLPDSGPVDRCEGVDCASPTPACHPTTGECVACLDISQCTPGSVCDVARGVCRPFAPRACSPCDTDVQCMDPEGATVGSCVTLEGTGGYFERVCVLTGCTDVDTCPTGLDCRDDRCVPRVGTCTGFIAAIERRGCNADEECGPFGAPAAEGQCEGAGMDGGTGVCLQPCGLSTDCPDGMTCTDGFCRPV